MHTRGSLRVSNDVIADVAGYAALECYGVVGMAAVDAADGALRLLPAWRLRRGIEVVQDGDLVVIDVHVILEAGVNVAQVAENLQSAISYSLKTIAELENAHINVHVEALR